MSLFPAYASKEEPKEEVESNDNSFSWLQNASCPPEVGQIPLPVSISSDGVSAKENDTIEVSTKESEEVISTIENADTQGEKSQILHLEKKQKKKDRNKKKKKKKDRKRQRRSSSSSDSSISHQQSSRSSSSASRSISKESNNRSTASQEVNEKGHLNTKKSSRSRSSSRSGSDSNEREKITNEREKVTLEKITNEREKVTLEKITNEREKVTNDRENLLSHSNLTLESKDKNDQIIHSPLQPHHTRSSSSPSKRSRSQSRKRSESLSSQRLKSRSGSCSSRRKRSRSKSHSSQKKRSRSRSSQKKRSKSRSCSSQQKRSRSRSCSSRKVRSRSHSSQKKRSRSHSSRRKRSSSRSHSSRRKRSRSHSSRRKRSKSCSSRRNRSRSRSYSSQKKISRSRSRSSRRKNSRSRSHSSHRKKSRSRSQSSRRKKSRSRSQYSRRKKSRSRSPYSRRKKSRSRSPYFRRRKSRSRSPYSRRKKSRSRSRSSRKKKSRSRTHSPRMKRFRSRRSRSRSHSSRKLKLSSRYRSNKSARSHSRDRLDSKGKRNKPKKRYSRSRSRHRERRHPRKRSRSLSKRRSRSQSRNKSESKEIRKISSKSKVRQDGRDMEPLDANNTSVEILVSKSKSIFLEDLRGLVKPEDAFHVDTLGDKNNLIFNETHFKQLVKFSIKHRRVLGGIASRGTSHNRKKPLRYFRRAAQKLLYCNAHLVKNLPLKYQEIPLKGNAGGYFPLDLTYSEILEIRPDRGHTNQLNEGENYILDLDGEDEESKGEEVEYAYWQKKSKDYNERLSKDPTNVDLWLEFVRFQEKSSSHLFSKSDKDEKKRKLSLKALAERKISILDTAIKKNIRSLELQFERLEVGKDLWDDKRLKHEWTSLLFNFPNKLEAWHWYLVFVLTHFTSFSLTNVVGAFAKCTEKLSQIKSGIFQTSSPPSEIGKCLVDITLQLAHVWKQAGYMERSIALFQGLIEFNVFAPTHAQTKDMTFEAKLALFEPFWDSRSPRFGEGKAVGWAQVMAARQHVEFPEVILSGTQDEEDDIIARGGNTSVLWLGIEMSRENCHWLAWELDPDDCEDSERMVSFEDIASHLYTLDTAEEHFYLILQFLNFLGVPYAHDLIMQRRRAFASNKGENCRIYDIFKPLIIENLLDNELFGRSLKLENYLNSDRMKTLDFPSIGPNLGSNSCSAYHNFVCAALQQSLNACPQPFRTDLTKLYIKYLGMKFLVMKENNEADLMQFYKVTKRNVKNILKLEEFRSSLPVYQEYGRLEEAMEHYDNAENVLATALTIGTAAPKPLDVTTPDILDIIELFMSYVELEVKRESDSCSGSYANNVVHSLCYLILDGKFVKSSGSPTSGSVILKARRHLIEVQSSNILSLFEKRPRKEKDSRIYLAAKLTSFLALLQLLTMGFKAAQSVYEESMKQLEDGHSEATKLEEISLPGEKPKKRQQSENEYHIFKPVVLEKMIEEFLWLLEISAHLGHMLKGERISPHHRREVLAKAVKVSPNNPGFLLQYTLSQTWRDLLGGLDLVSQDNFTILMTISRILPHIQRTVALLSSADEGLLSSGHRLESALEKGVRCLPGRNCPLLWRIYLALVAVTRPSGLKHLMYRAIASCPGVKSLYLDCIRLMPEMLKEIVTLLGEKGIRVRLPLEELQVLTEAEMDLEA